MAVQLLKTLTPAQVVVLDLAEDKLALARELGADYGVLASVDGARIRRRPTSPPLRWTGRTASNIGPLTTSTDHRTSISPAWDDPRLRQR
jgi:hypothetical protein